jgi:hypothetical protein
VRLDGNVRLTLFGDSSGTLFRDHFVLLRGEVEVAVTAPFRTEVTGLIVSASEPHTTGLISIEQDGVVNVSAQAGSFQVAKTGGSLLARVSPQKPLALSRTSDGEWRAGNGSNGDFGRDHHHCYVEDDDRDCDHHHHHHPSN